MNHSSPALPGVLRSIAIACEPDTTAPDELINLAAAPTVAVRDGARWTAYAEPAPTLALAGPSEMPAGATVALNVKVADVSAAHAALVAAGATSCAEPADGAHEVRASVWLAEGVALTVYQSR